VHRCTHEIFRTGNFRCGWCVLPPFPPARYHISLQSHFEYISLRNHANNSNKFPVHCFVPIFNFRLPPFQSRPRHQSIFPGYAHMISFWWKTIFEHPRVRPWAGGPEPCQNQSMPSCPLPRSWFRPSHTTMLSRAWKGGGITFKCPDGGRFFPFRICQDSIALFFIGFHRDCDCNCDVKKLNVQFHV